MMNAKEFIESEIKRDSHLKSHIERMDAVQQLEFIGLMERYANKLHQHTVSASVQVPKINTDCPTCGNSPCVCRTTLGLGTVR